MTAPAPFKITSLCRSTAARTGVMSLGRADVKTPIFMPVGTQGAIRSMPPNFLPDLKAQIILANTYHLHQRPGESLVQRLGGLHRFMATDLPILTDSGGFQVFSLRKKELSEEGVTFSYELDGKKTFLSPETSMAIQQTLGADIAMAFDECLPPEADYQTALESVDRTARWAERCLAAHTKTDQSLFGIVQGGMFGDLRKRSVGQITSLPFDGYAIGGLSVGEGPEKMNAMLAETMPLMPTDKARYLMGVGRPQDLVDGVATGIDMFDCVIPTRHARGGAIYTFQGRIRITHSKYRRDLYPLDTACECYTCRTFSRAYLHHLFEIGEVLGATLATIHNLRFFGDLMEKVRASITDGTFGELRKDIHALYPEKEEDTSKDEARKRFAEDALPVDSRNSLRMDPEGDPSEVREARAPRNPRPADSRAPRDASAPSRDTRPTGPRRPDDKRAPRPAQPGVTQARPTGQRDTRAPSSDRRSPAPAAKSSRPSSPARPAAPRPKRKAR